MRKTLTAGSVNVMTDIMVTTVQGFVLVLLKLVTSHWSVMDLVCALRVSQEN